MAEDKFHHQCSISRCITSQGWTLVAYCEDRENDAVSDGGNNILTSQDAFRWKLECISTKQIQGIEDGAIKCV